MNDQENKKQQLQKIAAYYNADAAPQDFKQVFKDSADSYDDLDNALYFLLNRFGSDVIRQRLRLAAEVHPHDIARRLIFENMSEDTADNAEADSVEKDVGIDAGNDGPERVGIPGQPATKLEKAKRLLGG